MLKRALIGLLALVALLVLTVAANTWRQGSRQVDVPVLAPIAVDEKAAGESLAAAVRAKTVSSATDVALITAVAHQDVVSVAPGTEKDWQAEPFAGTIRDGFVWGRSAWDDEANLVSQIPGTIVAPGLMIGGTDSQHFEIVADHIYKFSPVRAKAEDLPRFHGSNERITTANLTDLIRFHHRLVSQAAA